MIRSIFVLVISASIGALYCGSVSAQVASFQLTNPAIDAVEGDHNAAWVADENLGVLYCELVTQADSKRVECYDGNGKVSPSKEIPNRL